MPSLYVEVEVLIETHRAWLETWHVNSAPRVHLFAQPFMHLRDRKIAAKYLDRLDRQGTNS
jgi:hypothetical protein